MSFTAPLASLESPRPRAHRYGDRSRAIELAGRRFPSLTAAARALRCSITRVYYLIGERRRFPTARKA